MFITFKVGQLYDILMETTFIAIIVEDNQLGSQIYHKLQKTSRFQPKPYQDLFETVYTENAIIRLICVHSFEKCDEVWFDLRQFPRKKRQLILCGDINSQNFVQKIGNFLIKAKEKQDNDEDCHPCVTSLIYYSEMTPLIEQQIQQFHLLNHYWKEDAPDIEQYFGNIIDSTSRMAILLGVGGVGKSKLFNILFDQTVSDSSTKCFIEQKLNDQTILIDTPSVNLDNDVEVREQCIDQFAEYLQYKMQVIIMAFLVINFERTDMMKQKLTQVYKYFRNIFKNIAIIVTDWEKNESGKMESELKVALHIYKPQHILFIRSDISKYELNQQISNLLSIYRRGNSLQDTIFEVESTDKQKAFYEKLVNMMGQRQNTK